MSKTVTAPLDSEGIKAIIPHRHPFLLIDAITELEPGISATGSSYISPDESYFEGHFPGRPVMPGVLQVEAMAQTGAVAILSAPEYQGKIVFFGGIDSVRFKRTVEPGDTLVFEVTIDKMRRGVGKATGRALVGDDLVCKGNITFAVVEA